MVEAHYDDQQMDPDEQEYLMQQQMQMQQQQVYEDEYGQEIMMNQMGQYQEPSDVTNALVRTILFQIKFLNFQIKGAVAYLK